MRAGLQCVLAVAILTLPRVATGQETAPTPEPAPPPLPPEPVPTPPTSVPDVAPIPEPRVPSADPVPPPVTLPSPAGDDSIFTERPIPNREVDFAVNASFGGEWVRSIPRLSLDDASTYRGIGGVKLPSAGSLAMWRVQLGMDLVLWRRWVVPLLGVSGGAALGASDRAIASADGSAVQMRPWTTATLGLLGPGLGIRATHRRWTFATSARGALHYLWMANDVVAGAELREVTSSAWVPAVRVDLEACRRIGPLDRACLYVEARAYEATAMNGGSAGLRWEFGK